MIRVAATTKTNAGKAGSSTIQPEGIKNPAGNIALGIGIGLGLVLILLVQLFFDTPAEISVASEDASPAASSQTVELPKRQQSIVADRSAIAADAEAVSPDERVKSKPDDAKPAVRGMAREPAANTTRSQSIFGAYTIVKTAPVYSEPSEQSALITSLDPGTQVNVVATRRGWYEIRSRSGRPPGFIRQDGASRNR
jgi:hypothetical protein